MGKFFDAVFNNSYQVDAQATEGQLRQEYPKLLHETERIEVAFKDRGGVGRDGQYFTSHRILVQDGKGVGGKRKSFLSLPYGAILAFGVQTSAAAIDADVELNLWVSGHEKVSLDMAKGKVDLFQLYQYINSKITWSQDRGTADVIDSTPPNMDHKQSKLGNVVDWLGDNSKQIVAADVEKMFKTDYPILLNDEKVELAFKSGRDTTLFTSRRMLMVDVKGLFGKKIDFTTVLYSSIHGFGVSTAGSFFDRDAELKIYTNMFGDNDLYEIKQDFRQGKANLFGIQKALANHVLGDDKAPLPDVDHLAGHQDTSNGLFQLVSGLRFNQRPIDAVELNRVLHSEPPVLQGMEVVEMAFQGHRDLTVFTTKRFIKIDTKGLTGKKVEYFSIPWEKILAFGVRSAGAILDFDAEVRLYTEMGYYPGQAGKAEPPSPPIPAQPEQSFFQLDFNKNLVDLFKLKYYLSRRIIDISKLEHGAPIDLARFTGASPDPKGFERLFQWLGSDQRELDPTELDREFHTNTRILLDGEKILMAFKGGRDVSLFTNLRVMTLDVKGLAGCKIEYTSIPYRSIRAYSVESAGVWDRDSELNLYTRNLWDLAKVELDFRSGKTDIMQIQKMLAIFIVGLPEDSKVVFGPKNYAKHSKNKVGLNSLAVGFFDNSKEVSAVELNQTFHHDLPLLLAEETVLRAFAQARDQYLYTNRRLILVDTKGATGQRVKYKSIPYRYVQALEFETAGHLDRDAEIYLFTTIADLVSSGPPRWVQPTTVKQSILVNSCDIYEVGKLVLDHTFFGPTPRTDYDEAPEIALDLDGDGKDDNGGGRDVKPAPVVQPTAAAPPKAAANDDDGTEIEC